jgi:hypothetical protein
MTNEQDRPLWEVMIEAYEAVSGSLIDHMGREQLPGPDREECAAMLRALADVVVPEEPKPHVFDDSYTHGARDARLEIRALLLAEAERAEQGDDVQRHLDDFQNRHAADFQALAGE